jgi:Domain of unknown function (DUF2610)
MKSFDVPCEVGGQRGTFRIQVGQPAPGLPPLHFQAAWLWETHRGTIDPAVLTTLEKLLALAEREGLSFEDLCARAFQGRNEES